MNALQQAEISKYKRVYQRPDYRMGPSRYLNALTDLINLDTRGSLLDVGCGRGEMIREARKLGFCPVHGTEVVPELIDGENVMFGLGWNLPFQDDSFDVVTSFDVIEHILIPDQEPMLKEMERVAKKAIILTAASFSHKVGDIELHPGRRDPIDWCTFISSTMSGKVSMLKRRDNITSTFLVTYGL